MELDGQGTGQTEKAVFLLDYMAYCLSLMTNETHLKKKPTKSNILKGDVGVQNRLQLGKQFSN